MNRDLLIGLDEVSSELNKGYDKGLKNDNIAYFAKLLKVKTMRVWLNLHEIFKVRENDELDFIWEGLIRLDDYLFKMKEAGVERFDLLLWGYVYPFGYKANDKFTIPDPINEPEMYARFIKLQGNVAFEIARNYTSIQYFEPTNEPEDGRTNIHRNLNVFSEDNKAFSPEIVKTIVLDLCRSINKNVKKANKNAKVVMPGFMNIESTPAYLDSLYCAIESGEYPTVGAKTKKIDDFFDIMNWHPYNLKDSDINEYWLGTIDNIRAVMAKHGDINRTIWFNEIGWSDLRRETEYQVIANRYKDLFKTLQEKLPFVETFFPFRLFTLANKPEWEGEDNFGLVFNEYDWDTPLLPKPAYIELYKFVNGEDADLSPCYKLAKVKNRDIFRFKTENIQNDNFKVLFIGNGITYRKEAPWCGLNEGKGLGSSSSKNDFVHLVVENLKQKHKDVGFTCVDAYSYEKTFYNQKVFDELASFGANKPDVVIIFIGDQFGNASLADYNISSIYSKLIKAFKTENNKIICVSPLNATDETNNRLLDAAKENNVDFIDITDLKNNRNYLAKSECINTIYKTVPNDLGHKIIAQEITNKILKEA